MSIPFVWPEFDTIDDAKNAVLQGAGAAFFIAFATALVTFLSTQGVVKSLNFGVEAYFDAFLFMVMGFGMLRMSRLACLAAFILHILEQVAMFYYKFAFNPIGAIIFGLILLGAVRGSIAYHEFEETYPKNELTEKPALEMVKSGLGWLLLGVCFLSGVGAILFGFLTTPRPQEDGKIFPTTVKRAPQEKPLKVETDLSKIDESVETAMRKKLANKPTVQDPKARALQKVKELDLGTKVGSGEFRIFQMSYGQEIRGHVIEENNLYYTVHDGTLPVIVMKDQIVHDSSDKAPS